MRNPVQRVLIYQPSYPNQGYAPRPQYQSTPRPQFSSQPAYSYVIDSPAELDQQQLDPSQEDVYIEIPEQDLQSFVVEQQGNPSEIYYEHQAPAQTPDGTPVPAVDKNAKPDD
jgi:hypothetical protein